jgi:hypothetical protein
MSDNGFTGTVVPQLREIVYAMRLLEEMEKALHEVSMKTFLMPEWTPEMKRVWGAVRSSAGQASFDTRGQRGALLDGLDEAIGLLDMALEPAAVDDGA